MFYTQFDSPIGPITLHADKESLTGLYMDVELDASPHLSEGEEWIENPKAGVLPSALRQLREYFAGKRRDFDLPLRAQGTAFQKTVWRNLCKIPFGVTWSYGELAKRIGQPSASRAVGMANGRNPISIIVPCHRVIGANGTLTGYGGGLDRKRWLLTHEGCAFKD